MKLRSRLFLAPILTSVAAFALAPSSDVGAKGADPAARGLDLFVHAPTHSAPGATIPLQIQALGFPTATTLAPLGGATIDASWDPESLGPNVSAAPKTVTVTTDAAGRAHLDLPVPSGGERDLTLLLGATYEEHHRVMELRVHRVASREVALLVPDSRVVPGGATTAWAMVSDTTTGAPVAGETVLFELLEGGVARQTVRTVTDLAGTSTARVAIPWTDDPSFSWKLVARARTAADLETGSQEIALSAREETPGEPQLTAEWADSRVLPGDKITFAVRARDASDRPLAGLSVRYWIGPKGTDPPTPTIDPKGWERVSTLAVTDAAGEIKGAQDAPKNVRKGTSTSLRIVALAEVYGHGLRAERNVEVSLPSPSVTAYPEVRSVVPGIEQSLVVRVLDAREKPVQGAFTIEADGLSQKVTTDAWGQAEVKWKAPRDVGATRNVGPCAGGVAATVWVRPTAPIAALDNRTEPFSTCVPVGREIKGIARTESPMSTAGGKLTVRVTEAEDAKAKGSKADKKGALRAWSVLAQPASRLAARSVSAWTDDAEKPLDLALPSLTPGAWTISGLSPSLDAEARVAEGRVIVAPRVVPKIVGKIVGGRAAPLGTVEIDVDLTDGKGGGIPGSVAAMLLDAYGGGTTRGLTMLDTRGKLCRSLDVEDEACDAFFDDPKADTLRRRVLAGQDVERTSPMRDPSGSAKEDLRRAFKDVLLSLEGAVMEAAARPDTLRDVFRKDKSGYGFNPELFTLVTAAMNPPPETPGGEPIVLADLVALDKQVTFDNVARRVARLRLFHVLSAVRNYRLSHGLTEPDEPALRDPNALLRRAAVNGEIPPQDLVDPWGGTMAFVKAAGSGPHLPFVTVRGFELHAPGPDGKIGTADDVKSPFQRVLASKTPYAEALDEDRIVDAELDMEVADSTVSSWESMLQELTGQMLGGAVGILTSGHGSGGGGFGQGFGMGGIALVTRRTTGISSGAAYFAPPARTDDKGHIHLRVPLGDVETTWRLVLVGAPDGATPAVSTVDIASSLPLSARVDAGSAWIQGDEGDVVVTVRNRTAASAKVDLTMTAGGVAEIGSAADKARSIEVPAGGSTPVRVRVKAKRAGSASLDVVAKGPGGLEDRSAHTWDVRPAGEAVDLTTTQWLTGKATLALTQVGPHLVATGTPRLTLERGSAQAIEAALSALDPETIGSLDGLSYATEAAALVQRWAVAQRGESDPLAVRAADMGRRAVGRLTARIEALYEGSPNALLLQLNMGGVWSSQRRALRWAPQDLVKAVSKVEDCPPELPANLDAQLAILEAEPSSADGVIQPCWDSAVSSIVEDIATSTNHAALARVVIALAERPHRKVMATMVAEKLRAWTKLRPSGAVTLPALSSDRSSRALVFAALLRTADLGKPIVTTPDKLAAWLRVQRDVRGGYGTTLATLAAVRALINQPGESNDPTKVTIVEDGVAKQISVRANETISIPLNAKTLAIDLEASGPGVIARLSRPGLRLWTNPPDTSSAPVSLDLMWPEKPKVGVKQVLRVMATSRTARMVSTDIRIPLPPGVTLAEGGSRAHQVQGQLVMRLTLAADGTNSIQELPIRFGLAGKFTIPEAKARTGEAAEHIVPSRPIVVGM